MKFKERITQPQTIRQFIVFVFWLWVIYGTLNYRIESLERFRDELHVVDLHSTLSKIVTDIEWIKNVLNK